YPASDDPMARNRLCDTEKLSSHAPGIGAREPSASAAARRVEGPPAAGAADRDGPTVLGLRIEAVDELAAFAAGRPAANRSWLASARVSTLLGVEESAPIRSPVIRQKLVRSAQKRQSEPLISMGSGSEVGCRRSDRQTLGLARSSRSADRVRNQA